MNGRAVVLLSGGIDSSTTLGIAKENGFEIYALTVDYHQKHRYEIKCAKRIAKALGVVQHLILKLDLSKIGGSALTDQIPVPKPNALKEIGTRIPPTYVPARNTILLALALAWAEVLEAMDIFIGANAVDYSGYPDCRPEFISMFEQLANRATKAGIEGKRFAIHAPLIHYSKAEIIRKAVELKVPLQWTHSCYDPLPNGVACGECDSCLLRKKGFQEANVPDPTKYAK